MNTRVSWDEMWLAMAEVASSRSQCVRAKVGCVIVTADNRVASVSYNGPPAAEGRAGMCDGWCRRAQCGTSVPYSACATIHAEMNGVLRSDFSQIQGGTLYVNGSMCADCGKVIAGSGLRRVVHVVRFTDAHRSPEEVEAYLRERGIIVDRAESRVGLRVEP